MIDRLDLQVQPGEFVAILGSNGSGKSTLARLMNGMLLPSQGSVTVDGMDSRTHSTAIKKRVGLLHAQPDHHFIAPTVEEDVAFGPENLGLSPAEIRSRVQRALQQLSMEELAKHPPYLLSGGLKQKAALAGLLAMQPGYLILDEPTSMLDQAGQREVIQALLSLRQEGRVGLIWITHQVEEVVMADRIIILQQGQIALEGSPRDILPQTDKMRCLGVAPLEVRVLIDLINRGIPSRLSDTILLMEDLIKALCHLR
ncbi:MAG: ATP-binding cassette domain-containing protein [Syntrophomonadaceae bacterium]